MKILLSTTLFFALTTAPLVVMSQNAPAQATQSAVQLSDAQKSAILSGDTSAVTDAIEAAGVDSGDSQAMGALAADIFNQVFAGASAADFEGGVESVTATITQAFTQVTSATMSNAAVAQTVGATSRALSTAAVQGAVARGSNPSNAAQFAARGAVAGAREGAVGNAARSQMASAAANGSGEGASAGAASTGQDVAGIVAASNAGSAQAGGDPSRLGFVPVVQVTPPDPSVQVVSPEGSDDA